MGVKHGTLWHNMIYIMLAFLALVVIWLLIKLYSRSKKKPSPIEKFN
jgi:positive regulator of sigma E activity